VFAFATVDEVSDSRHNYSGVSMYVKIGNRESVLTKRWACLYSVIKRL